MFVVEVDDGLNDRDVAAALGAIEGVMDDARVMVLDCAGLEDIGSGGVGNIMRLKARLGVRGGTLRLAALQPRVESVLMKARADHVVEIYKEVGTAVVRRVSAVR